MPTIFLFFCQGGLTVAAWGMLRAGVHNGRVLKPWLRVAACSDSSLACFSNVSDVTSGKTLESSWLQLHVPQLQACRGAAWGRLA